MKSIGQKLTFLLLLCSFNPLSAQNDKSGKDTCCDKQQFHIGFLSLNTDNSVYTAMQNIWYSNENISYLCFFPVFSYIEPLPIPLRDGEGENGFLFEGSIYHQAPIAMGRNHSEHWRQTFRATFDYGFNVRMALDNSNPLIPNNNRIGFTVEKYLWDSYTKHQPFSKSKQHVYSNWNNLERPLSTLSLNLTFHHYSNGQPPGFFLQDTIDGKPVQRNDYLRGDFSTNYGQVGLTFSHMNTNRSIFSVKLAYQRDGEVVGPLHYSIEQDQSYGYDRLNGFLQYRHVWTKLNEKEAKTIVSVCDSCNPIRQAHLFKSYELVFRLEYEAIMGNLSKYPHDNKYRINPHVYIEFTRKNLRALGIVLHYYYGRDYSNIRYDLPISTIMIGMAINFNKYLAPFSDKQKFDPVFLESLKNK